MPPAEESPRRRWLILGAAWMLAAVLIVLHTVTVLDYVALLNQTGHYSGDAASTPLRQVIPARYGDAQMWVRHALDGSEAGQARVRFTTVDNAPAGREVHWSSGFLWLIRGAAVAQESAGGQPKAAALERVLLWFNAPLLFAAIVGLSIWTMRRFGAAAGVLVVCAMVGHPRFYEGFSPTYVDHHGLVNVALLGLVLGAAFMGFGWWRPGPSRDPALLPVSPGRARRAAMFSALCGAMALWHSAAAALPTIAFVGLAGLAVARWQGRRAEAAGARFEPGLWRLWGRTGAAASLACYLLEYAPANLGWRLEVNHPLYSLAWWGGAEVVAILGVRQSASAGRPSARVSRLLVPLLAIAAAPAAILFGGTTTFVLSDPFVSDLRHFVAESRSLAASVRQFGLGTVVNDLVSTLLLVPAAIFLWRRRDGGGLVIGALTLITTAFVLMAFFVMRWWLVAGAVQVALLVGLVTVWADTPSRRWAVTLAIAGVLFVLPATLRIWQDHTANKRLQVAEVDLFQPLYRDLAATLQTTHQDGGLVLLANPNASAGISYFGRFQSVGTLFWENAPGLRAAAGILCAESDDEALRLIRARGITHVVMFSAAPFVGEYFRLLHPDRPLDDGKRTFGFRLASDYRSAPRWLQAIPYQRPADLAAVGGEVGLFKVVPEQTEDQWWFHTAVAQVARGETSAAEQSFLSALEQVPAKVRASLCGFAGEAAYEYGSHALAVRMLRRGLQFNYDPGVANLTAWIMATSVDASVRDGAAALALVTPIARRDPDDPAVASTLAAAFAELGRFEEAVQAAELALALVRRDGGGSFAEALLAGRLEAYQARHPWRQ